MLLIPILVRASWIDGLEDEWTEGLFRQSGDSETYNTFLSEFPPYQQPVEQATESTLNVGGGDSNVMEDELTDQQQGQLWDLLNGVTEQIEARRVEGNDPKRVESIISGSLDNYSTCKDVIANEDTLMNIRRRNVHKKHRSRLTDYKGVLTKYHQFKDKSAFMELFGGQHPSKVHRKESSIALGSSCKRTQDGDHMG